MSSRRDDARAYPMPYADSAELTLRDYWRALLAQRWLVVGIALVVLAIALAVSLLMPTKYRATSTLQIEREPMNVVNVDSLMPVESPQDRDFYETQYELLRSRSLAKAVVREAGLAAEARFKPLAGKAGADYDAAHSGAGAGAGAGDDGRREHVEQALAGTLLQGLEIEPIRNSRLVRINFDSPDPALAAKVANAYAKVFIDSGRQRRLEASASASKYLSERLVQLQQKVEESEAKLVAYSGQERIVSVGDDKPSLPAQNLAELNALLASAQESRIRAEAAWRQASQGDGMGIPQVVANPLVQQLRAEQVRLQAEYRQKLATFKPGYPEMQRLDAQVGELQRQVNGEVLRIRQSLRDQYQAAARQEELMNQRIGTLMDDELDLQSRSIQYNLLKREVDTNRQLFDAILQRYKEIGVAGNVADSNVSIVDPAVVPARAHSPKLMLNLALGAIFGLFIAVSVALVRFLLRDPPVA
ncbi:polysaccharide biosynthesis protein GumC [Pseudoxanthomonas jiangsuensis]|nr:GumC family protein [Pseudoxanthomonas jiangsuensis]KAF1695576.1 polysaccharide biosynthesis protein GumC [Pseudoxanthomonas jiangsuensis]